MDHPATAPPRGFTPQDLERLPREQRLQLGCMLVTEWGLQVLEVDRRADYDDLVVQVEPLLRARRARVRLAYRTPCRDDLAVLAELARNDGLADFLLIAMSEEDGSNRPDGNHYIPARTFIELLEGSALVRWAGGVPEASRREFAWLQAHQARMLTADTVGLRWLPALALNKVPWPLRGLGGTADDLFERIFFRVMTGRLRQGPGKVEICPVRTTDALAPVSGSRQLACGVARAPGDQLGHFATLPGPWGPAVGRYLKAAIRPV
ncbi:MAG TPA: hypothetical protein VG276_06810 [Actinomycetes bacterium]|jgi:hypothetical protein|nr:hypothetical protein [Actinomycetes bacterium]